MLVSAGRRAASRSHERPCTVECVSPLEAALYNAPVPPAAVAELPRNRVFSTGFIHPILHRGSGASGTQAVAAATTVAAGAAAALGSIEVVPHTVCLGVPRGLPSLQKQRSPAQQEPGFSVPLSPSRAGKSCCDVLAPVTKLCSFGFWLSAARHVTSARPGHGQSSPRSKSLLNLPLYILHPPAETGHSVPPCTRHWPGAGACGCVARRPKAVAERPRMAARLGAAALLRRPLGGLGLAARAAASLPAAPL